jgi:hypothetical protein
MAATPYELPAPSTAGRARARLRLRLPAIGRVSGGLGVLVVGIGILVIGIGWAGIAGPGGEVNHTPNLAAQMPYLLSGGALGLSLVVLGAALMVINAQRQDRSRLEARLEELTELMARSAAGAAAPAAARAGLVVAGSASYHRPDCRLVDGRTDLALMAPQEAAGAGLSACRVCRPAQPR